MEVPRWYCRDAHRTFSLLPDCMSARLNLMGKKAYEPTSKDRRRFAFDKANELWMSDVMQGGEQEFIGEVG